MTRNEKLERQIQKTRSQMRALRDMLDRNNEAEAEIAYELNRVLLRITNNMEVIARNEVEA